MNGTAFEIYIETQLAPVLASGSGVILDNLSAHKVPRAAKILKQRGCWFLFLPPYSPDPNPIEMAFSKPKAHLRRIGLSIFDAFVATIGGIRDLLDLDECFNFLKNSVYVEN